VSIPKVDNFMGFGEEKQATGYQLEIGVSEE
jgi:hypothetical protein